MRLKVLKPQTRFRGTLYNRGDVFEVDPKGHNVRQEVNFLMAVGRVADAPAEVAPVGRVASTAAPEPAPVAPTEPAPKPPAEARAPPRRSSGRTSRRDLRAKD